MPSPTHDAWCKSTFGLDPATCTNAAALPAPGPDKQSQDFHAKVQAALGPIDQALDYLAANAHETKSAPVAAGRQILIAAYQTAAQQIDPADDAKAKPAVAKALGLLQATAAQAAAARVAAEKALADWKAVEPKGQVADDQLAEMTDWGHAGAPPLRAPLEAVLAQATAKQYTEACTALAAFLPTLAPVWDDYQKQRAAQAEYEPARKDIDPRLANAAKSSFKTLAPMQQELPPAQADMDKDAGAKAFVDALAKEKALTAKLDEYERALADLQAKKQAFDAARADVQPKLDAAAQVDHPSLAPLQQDLQAGHTQMDQAEQAEDFDHALATAQTLSDNADAFAAAVKTLEQQKQEFDAFMAALQPRLDTAAQCPFKSLQPMQDDLAKQAALITDATKTEDYGAALKTATDLASRTDEFEASVKAIQDKKKAYEDARQTLDPKLAAADQAAVHKPLEADKKAIGDAVPIMEKAAGDEDFSAALGSAQDLAEKADKYVADAKAIEDKKQQFTDAWAKIQPLLDDIKSCRNDDLAPMQQTILKSVDDINASAAGEDYDSALRDTDTLSRMFDEYLKADANQIVSVSWNGKTYYGTGKELEALKLNLVRKGIDQAFGPVQNHAEAIEGQYNDLKALNDKQYIVAWFVTGIGGAHLENVASGIAAHKQAIGAMRAATESQQAQDAYKAACEAVSASGKALSDYMSALDLGGKIVVYTLQAVEVTCFAVAAACGAAVILPAGSGILASMAANGISGMTFGALEATAQQAAPLTQGEKVDWQKAKIEIGKAALLNGAGGLLGGAMGGKLKEDVGEIVIEKLAIDNPEVKKRVLGAIEGSFGNMIQTAIAARPDLGSGKMTVGEFTLLLAENAIAGGLGGAITPGMKKLRVSA